MPGSSNMSKPLGKYLGPTSPCVPAKPPERSRLRKTRREDEISQTSRNATSIIPWSLEKVSSHLTTTNCEIPREDGRGQTVDKSECLEPSTPEKSPRRPDVIQNAIRTSQDFTGRFHPRDEVIDGTSTLSLCELSASTHIYTPGLPLRNPRRNSASVGDRSSVYGFPGDTEVNSVSTGNPQTVRKNVVAGYLYQQATHGSLLNPAKA